MCVYLMRERNGEKASSLITLSTVQQDRVHEASYNKGLCVFDVIVIRVREIFLIKNPREFKKIKFKLFDGKKALKAH